MMTRLAENEEQALTDSHTAQLPLNETDAKQYIKISLNAID